MVEPVFVVNVEEPAKTECFGCISSKAHALALFLSEFVCSLFLPGGVLHLRTPRRLDVLLSVTHNVHNSVSTHTTFNLRGVIT